MPRISVSKHLHQTSIWTEFSQAADRQWSFLLSEWRLSEGSSPFPRPTSYGLLETLGAAQFLPLPVVQSVSVVFSALLINSIICISNFSGSMTLVCFGKPTVSSLSSWYPWIYLVSTKIIQSRLCFASTHVQMSESHLSVNVQEFAKLNTQEWDLKPCSKVQE